MTKEADKFRRAAKTLRKAFEALEPEARVRVAAVFPEQDGLNHADALHVIAREQGHDSWPKLKFALETAALDLAARRERLKIALYHGQGWMIDALMSAEPDLSRGQMGLSCALYDLDEVGRLLGRDPGLATRPDGIRRPILHLTFSQFWKSGGDIEAQLVIARLLCDHGADVNDGFPAEPGSPHLLSALYGALGHAGNLRMARWLLDHGATPDDNESLYHATELGALDGLRMLLEHGATIAGTNALPRMLDFNDLEGVRLLLDHGADPNEGIGPHPSGAPSLVIPALHQAARRMCSGEIAQLLIDRGADGRPPYLGHSAYALARIRGNREVAEVLARAGQATPLDAAEAKLAQAAEGPVNGRIDPAALSDETRRLLCRIAGEDGRLAHLQRLVRLGLDPDETDEMGMPAIHVAGWEGQADTVEWLLEQGPSLTAKNDYGGDLMGTIIHGAEFCPNRSARDHLRCAIVTLDAGAPLHMSDVEGCGAEELADYLRDWADVNPNRVVPSG